MEGAMSLPPLYCGEVGLLTEMRDAGWTVCSFFHKGHKTAKISAPIYKRKNDYEKGRTY